MKLFVVIDAGAIDSQSVLVSGDWIAALSAIFHVVKLSIDICKVAARNRC